MGGGNKGEWGKEGRAQAKFIHLEDLTHLRLEVARMTQHGQRILGDGEAGHWREGASPAASAR